MILALAGGVGGARLAQGLVQALAPDALGIAVNIGDDFEHLGLHVCPDLDTVMYTLAGVHNAEAGWGGSDETWHFMDTLQRLGGDTWFRLGDRDLAVRHQVMLASDQRLRTRVLTDASELDFQDYFVRRRCEPALCGLRFDGADSALPSPALDSLIASGKIGGIVICLSNPWLSIAPMFAIDALAEFIDAHRVPVVAVSPIIEGRAVKGPAGKIMRELGGGEDALGVVRYYGARVDGWVIDRQDAALAPAIEAAGHSVQATETLMSSPERTRRLADAALGLLHFASSRR